MLFRILWCVALIASLAGAQTRRSFTNAPTRAPLPPIDLAHDSHVRQLFANSEVHVYRIDLDPGAETAMDRHDRDFLVISLGNSNFEFAGPNNSVPMTMTDNEVEVMKGHWPHRIVNKSSAPLHLVEVETTREILPEKAICGLAAQSCTGAHFAKDDSNNYIESTLFLTPSTRLGKIEIAPAAGMPQHTHDSSSLLIALDDQQITDAFASGSETALDLRAGQPEWIERKTPHRIVNNGSQPARFLILEWR